MKAKYLSDLKYQIVTPLIRVYIWRDNVVHKIN